MTKGGLLSLEEEKHIQLGWGEGKEGSTEFVMTKGRPLRVTD